MTSLPLISIPTVALFFAEVRGFSKLYDNVHESPLGTNALTSSRSLCYLVVVVDALSEQSVVSLW